MASAFTADPWMTLSRSPSFQHGVTVEIGTLETATSREYWFKRTAGTEDGPLISWTDTTRCPAARSLLGQVRKLKMPRVSVPWFESDEMIVTADGTHYELSGEAAYGSSSAYDFKIASNLGTPLAAWIDNSLRILEPCWSKEEPRTS